jgi:hypothetical protein
MVKWNGVAFKCVLLSFLLLFSCCARATSALSQFLIKTSKGGKAALNLFTPATKLVLKLDFNEEYNLHEYKFNEVRNALTSLASSQSTLKSLDGLTHKIRNTVKDNTSLQSRFKKYIKSDKRNVKEAGKLYEYTNSVERGLQAAEILQSVSFATENERHLGLDELGLVELKRIFVTSNGIQCTITFLVATNQQQQVDYDSHKTDLSTSNKDERRRLQSAPRRYLPNELIVAIVDDSSSATSTDSHSALVPLLATILSEAPVTVEIGEEGFSQDEVSLQPSLLSLSRQVLMALAEFILPEELPRRSETQPEEEEVEVKKKKIAKSSKNKRENPKSDFSNGGELDRNAKRVSPASDSHHRSSSSPVGVSKLPPVVARCGRLVPSRVRLLGHSAGGAVAAYVSMALDGTLRGLEAVLVEDGPEATKGAQEEEQAAGDLSRCTGAFHDKVRCVALGPPPCVSRSVVPQYIRCVSRSVKFLTDML